MDPTSISPASDDSGRGRLRFASFGLAAGALLLYAVGLGATDLWAPDEPRYGAIAEELRSMRHGLRGLVVLHLNDTVFTQKPPLYFWLAALAGLPESRVTEFAARLPSAIAALASLALTVRIGRALFGQPAVALLAAGLLGTSFRFAFTARRAQLDVLLTALELSALVLFVWLDANRASPPSTAKRFAVGGLHAALGAATLVKGPVGWLPLAIIAVFLLWEGRGRDLRAIVPRGSWLLSVAPLALWTLAAIALAPAGFAEHAIGDNLLGRFFAGTSHARPIHYFLVQTPLDFLPWTLVAPLGLIWLARAARAKDSLATHAATELDGRARRRAAARFLICWIAVPFVFFSLSAGKRGGYLLPIFPALALACAAGTLSSTWLAARVARPARGLAVGIALVAAVELSAFAGLAPWLLGPHKSPRPLAVAVARHSRPDEAVGVYAMTPLEGAIGYYGDRPVRSLHDEEALRHFLSEGGRVVILRSRHLEALADDLGLEELEAFRSGRRRLSLAVPAPDRYPLGTSRRVWNRPGGLDPLSTERAYIPALTPFSGIPRNARTASVR